MKAKIRDSRLVTRHSLLVTILSCVLCLVSCVLVYAFLAHELTKVDVSAPDPYGPVVVPENYQNLLVLDVAIPRFDAGPMIEDTKLHNGVAGSSPRDILTPFDSADWYSDHDGDMSFDGNVPSDNTEAIVSSDDDILDPSDVVRKTGLCLIEPFTYYLGFGDQYIDGDHNQNYTPGEAVVRLATYAGELHPGEVVLSGAADMTAFLPNVCFTDGIDGNATPVQYHDGEAIIVDAGTAGILSDDDTVLTKGNADLNPFPDSVVYSDLSGNGRYNLDEAIIGDGGIPGQLDAGSLDGTGVDSVIRPGKADFMPMVDEGLLFVDDNGDDAFSPGECIIRDGGITGIVEPGDIVRPGLTHLKPLSGNDYLFTDDDVFFTPDGAYTGDLDLTDGYQGEAIFSDENGDSRIDDGELVTAGYAALKAFTTPADAWFVDSQGNAFCDSDEAVIVSDDDLLSSTDTIARPGFAFLKPFNVGIKWADANHNSQYDDEELIAETSDDILSPGEVIRPGYCDLKVLSGTYEGQVYSDNDGSNSYSSDELVIFSDDKILDAGDSVSTPGRSCLVSLQNSSTKFIDADGEKDFDLEEAIVYNRGSSILILDDSDGVARSGLVDIKSIEDEVVYIDHSADGAFQGDSDNDVNWEGPDAETCANDPDIINDQDEVVLRDPLGPGHLSLDPDDKVLRPGLALLTAFSGTDTYTDDGDEEYDGDGGVDPNEAVIQDGNINLLLDSTDVVLVTGVALIRDFSPPEEQTYIDANNDGVYSPGEAIIMDSSPGGTPNGLLDAGALDGTGIDMVEASGEANLRQFSRAEKFVDGNRNGSYNAGEAIIYDWYKSDTLVGEFMLVGDPEPASTGGWLTYQAPGARTRDSVLLASTTSVPLVQLNATPEHWYVDNDHSGIYDGFYTGSYEAILWSANDQLEEGELDGTGTDRVLAAGYASMRHWSLNEAIEPPEDRENLTWADSDHDGEYQVNEAIVYDAGGDRIVTSIGTGSGDDQIIFPGEADLKDFEYKYVDANSNGLFDEGELRIVDADGDDKVQNDEIVAPGLVPFLEPFAFTDYRYCDPDGNDEFHPQEAIVHTPVNPTILEAEDQVITAGYVGLVAFAVDPLNMFVDYDHDNAYDANEAITYGNGDQIFEATDQVIVPGAANSFDGTDYKYSDADRNDNYTHSELIANSADHNLENGEIALPGPADLDQFSTGLMYIDVDEDGVYSGPEAILYTADANLDSDDQVLASGPARLHFFETSIYRFADADHDDMYDEGEAIIVETGWKNGDDYLENSDIILLEGLADIEQFPLEFVFLDDEDNSNAYEDGEAIVNDLNGNGLLEPGEIVTGGEAALTRFTGGERYIDGGEGDNARNSQYNQDEAIIRDGNYNDYLDSGPLDGTGNDAVLSPGKAGLTGFDADERYVDKNTNGEYDGGQHNSEDIYLDNDSNGILTLGDDALEYFVVENVGTQPAVSDLAAVKLWADRDSDGQFEMDTDDAPALASLLPDASNPRVWYEGPAPAPPLSASSSRAPVDYTISSDKQRLFVTVDISSAPADGSEIQMGLPLNGVKTFFGLPGPSDMTVTNAYIQKIDYATPDTAEITSPPAGAVLSGQVTLRGEASDTIQVGKMEFYIGPPGEGNVPIAVDEDGAPWEALWTPSNADYGYQTLYARVYDRTYLRPPPVWGIDHYLDSQGVPITIALSSTVDLVEGWNLISVPVEASDTSIGSVLSSIVGDFIAVWTYAADTSKWLRYDLEGPNFLNDLNTIRMGNGYWILMSSASTLSTHGDISGTAILLQAGWNLVGCNSLTPLDIVDAMSSIDCEFSVWTYDPETEEWLNYDPGESFNDLDSMEPGRGYLIYTAESCIWDTNSH